MMEIIKEKDFEKLPANMQHAAEEAYESLLHTRDGQLCDVIIDKAALEAIYAAGKEAKADIIRDYAESTVGSCRYQDCRAFTENREIDRFYEAGNG